MKNNLINPRFTVIALVALFVTAFTAPAMANDEKNVIPVELKFLGNIKNQPLFELNFNANESESEITVAILDIYGNTLYKDVVKGANISKKFLLNTEEIGNDVLRFEITGKKTNKTVVYEVNRNSRIVEDLVVNKLK